MRQPPTPQELRRLLVYEPDTGKLYWRKRPVEMFAHCPKPKSTCLWWNVRFAGTEALATVSDGYKAGRIFGQPYISHRVAYAIMTGEWPTENIDHINGDPGDNRWENLRAATHQENMKNMPIPRNNKSGRIGVCRHKASNRWMAQIGVDGRRIILGYFERKEDAIRARKEAEIKYGFHPNHGRAA